MAHFRSHIDHVHLNGKTKEVLCGSPTSGGKQINYTITASYANGDEPDLDLDLQLTEVLNFIVSDDIEPEDIAELVALAAG